MPVTSVDGVPAAAPPPAWAPPPSAWAPPPIVPAPSATDPAGEGGAVIGPNWPLNRRFAAGEAPDSRSSAWTWLLFAALGFLGGQVLAALVVALSAAVSGNLHSLAAITKLSEPPTWYIVSTLIGLWAGFFGSAWVASSARGTHSLVRDVGLRFRWIDLLGLPIGLGGQFVVALMYVPIAQHVHNFNQRFDAPSQRLTGGSHGTGYIIVAICTVVGAPFFEELFFRGVLLRALARLFGTVGGWVGPALAIIITGILFGLAHAESLQLLGLATFGVILSFISYRTGRLGMNMIAHASFNLVALAAVVIPMAAGHGVLF
jgi:membrane protease YdiL (CAAX protease family)